MDQDDLGETPETRGAVNREGLTYEEWLAAANCFRKEKLKPTIAFREWKRGVDPTEYADSSAK